jgi:hypothetical protein
MMVRTAVVIRVALVAALGVAEKWALGDSGVLDSATFLRIARCPVLHATERGKNVD